MNHFKLVHGTTAPTRYTKIVFVPGKDTKFVKQYQETEYVSRYTKLAAPPASWTPPAPDPDPITIVDGKGANWVSKDFYISRDVIAKTAQFAGGLAPMTYRARFQTKDSGSNEWNSEPWITVPNEKVDVTFQLTKPCDIRFQSQAKDSNDPADQLNSTTGTKKAIPLPTIGTITIDPANLAAPPGDIITLTATWSGDAQDSLPAWKIRSGPGMIYSTMNIGNTVQVQVNPDASAGSSIQVQCDISNVNTSDTPQSTVATIVVEASGTLTN
jgi:hypothetical protein